MRRITISLLVIILAIGLLAVIPNHKIVSASQTAEDLFDKINSYRTSKGLSEISWHAKCYTVAYKHTQNMHNTSQLSHELNGRGADDRLNDAGIGWTCYVENVAFNQGHTNPVQSAFDQWKSSVGHNKNMLNDCIESGAVAIVSSKEKGYFFTFLAVDNKVGKKEVSSNNIKHTMSATGKSPIYTLSYTNTGQTDLTYTWEINYINGSGWIVVTPNSSSIIPGETCEFEMSFDPSNLSAGVYKASIIFTGQAGSETIPVELTVTGDNGATTVELWIGSDIMRVNGKTVRLNASPQIISGRTLVPVRVISEAFGAKVSWDGDERKVAVSLGSSYIEMWIDSSTAFVGNVKATLEPPPTIISGRTFVPFRFIGEALGGTVEWDGNERKVTITIE